MKGLCAPSTVSIDEELTRLYDERDRITEQINKAIALQNKATGIKEDTMEAVYSYLINYKVERIDRDDIFGIVEHEFYSMSHKDIIDYVEAFEMGEEYDHTPHETVYEPCIAKMLKEHAANILLKG
jgi:hypothetical protein